VLGGPLAWVGHSLVNHVIGLSDALFEQERELNIYDVIYRTS
jgi:hypothetical protein